MKLHIKNMVCDRCTLVVRGIAERLGLEPVAVRLGEVDFGDRSPGEAEIAQFADDIAAVGFELISDRRTRQIADIKRALIALVQGEIEPSMKLSTFVADALHHDYNHLSHLFSSVEGMTIEQFFILQKIEKTKELLVYDELTLTGIALRLGYSSVAHLSRQFKQVTGLTPTAFRQLRDPGLRRAIDSL